MNDDTGGNRGLRRAGILAVMAATAVLATACGGSTSSSASSTSGLSATYRQALAYTECMRSHGVPDFPDPDANGAIAITSSTNPDSSQMQAAQNACQHLQPGGNVSPAQAQQNLATDLKLAQCMRTHGVPDYPDPGEYATGAPSLGKGANQTPQFLAAQRTCRSLLHLPEKPQP